MTTTPVPTCDGLPRYITPLRVTRLFSRSARGGLTLVRRFRAAAFPSSVGVTAATVGATEKLPPANPLVPDDLESYRQEAGLSHGELWVRYFELGGMSTGADVEAIVGGVLVTSDQDRDVIALALNERFAELGRDYPVPYATE